MAPLHCPLGTLGRKCYDRSYILHSLTPRVFLPRGIGIVRLRTADEDVVDIRLVLLVELVSLWLGVSRAPRLHTQAVLLVLSLIKAL